MSINEDIYNLKMPLNKKAKFSKENSSIINDPSKLKARV